MALNFMRKSRSICRSVLQPNVFATKRVSSQSLTSTQTHCKDENKAHSTVDTADVERHTKLMDEWWNTRGPMKALHSYNLIRVPFVRDGLVEIGSADRQRSPLKGKKVLDIGCGGGILSEALARLGATVTGVDASKDLIDLARRHSEQDPRLANNRPTYEHSSIEEHATKNIEKYDGVVASEIIEHVDNKELFVKSCIQTLKPGGRIFFTTPSKTRICQLTGIYIAEYVLKIVPKGTHQYEKFTTPNELTFLLERNNCHVEAVYGMFYDFLTNRWSWINSQVFMFALQAVKLKS